MSDITIRTLLETTAFRPQDVEELLDASRPTYTRFDAALGYAPSDVVLQDGVDRSRSTYTYEPAGQRKMTNYRERPCRINTYGDSVTQCQQVSDDETWQERLAAHLGEPIRNFGCGGYSVYQAYRRAMIVEVTDIAAEYVILNIWDDDHVRSLDAARWIRTAWDDIRDPRDDEPWSLHGLPWPHLRIDLETGKFAERPGLCQTTDDLRRLTDPERFYEAFKDDEIVRLFVLENGGDAPTGELVALAEILGVEVDLKDPARRAADAHKLRVAYGLQATEYTLDAFIAWAKREGRKLMVLLTYCAENITEFVERGRRFDQCIIDHLQAAGVPYVDGLVKVAEDFKAYRISLKEYLGRLFLHPAGAAVFDHYGPGGNHFFAFSFKNELVDWLDPKPPAYQNR